MDQYQKVFPNFIKRFSSFEFLSILDVLGAHTQTPKYIFSNKCLKIGCHSLREECDKNRYCFVGYRKWCEFVHHFFGKMFDNLIWLWIWKLNLLNGNSHSHMPSILQKHRQCTVWHMQINIWICTRNMHESIDTWHIYSSKLNINCF